MQPKNPDLKFNHFVMGDSGFASKWNTVEAPNKIAALRPMMPTYNRAFALGAANMI